MIQIQYDLFENRDELTLIKKEMDAIKKRDDNIRRGLFARYDSLSKTVVRQQEEIDELKGIILKKRKT